MIKGSTSHDYSNIKENFKVAKEMSKKRKAISPGYRKSKRRNHYVAGICWRRGNCAQADSCDECVRYNLYQAIDVKKAV